MRMPQSSGVSLWHALSPARDLSNSFLWDRHACVRLGGLVHGSALEGRGAELSDRSVLISTRDQLTAALALIELDGIARRLVLCPSDLLPEHLPFVIDAAAVDAIVSDRATLGPDLPGAECFITCSSRIVPGDYDRSVARQTEWILLTSGTTGLPKLVVHTLASLAGAIESGSTSPS